MQIRLARFKNRNTAGRALVVASLLAATFLTVHRSFGEFGFYYDDWSYVQQLQQNGSVGLQFPSRLLHQPLVELMFSAVGYNPMNGYLIVAALLLASVLAMYWMVSALFPRRHAFAALSTLLFALYPGDVSRLWMSAGMTSNRPAVLMALIALALMFTALRVRYSRLRVSTALMWTSVVIYGASLFLYEAQALLVPGLGFAGALWISWSSRGLSHRNIRRKALYHAAFAVVPHVFVFVGLVAWRALFLDSDVEDGYLASASLNPAYLFRQLAGVYYFNFIEMPWETVREGVPFVARFGWLNIGMALLASIALSISILVLSYRKNRSREEKGGKPRANPDVIIYRNIFLVGLALTAVVYAVLLPHDHIISAGGLRGPFVSRLNTSAAVIVAMTVAAGVMFAWMLMKSWLPAQRLKIDVGAGALIGTGALLLIVFHGIVQSDYADAWDLQKSYTAQILDEAPYVEPETHFVIAGAPTQHGSSYVYMFSVEHMLRIVYGDESIRATAINDGFNAWRLDETGLYRSERLVAPVDQIVFFEMDRIGCEVGADKSCGRLTLSDDVGRDAILAGYLGPDSALALSDYSRISSIGRVPSPIDDLLGIELGTATVSDTENQPPTFGAPSDMAEPESP